MVIIPFPAGLSFDFAAVDFEAGLATDFPVALAGAGFFAGMLMAHQTNTGA